VKGPHRDLIFAFAMTNYEHFYSSHSSLVLCDIERQEEAKTIHAKMLRL
jgi:hypothetical protein